MSGTVKSPLDVTATVQRRLDSSWHRQAVADAGLSTDPELFPWVVPLGQPTQRQLEENFAAFQGAALEWNRWAAANNAVLTCVNRVVHRTNQSFPTHVTILTSDAAVRIAGKSYADRLARGTRRTATLATAAPDVEADVLAAVVRTVDAWVDIDVSLACTAVAWFRENDAAGLTPRQVPLPGFHAKWLQSHRSVVEALAGRPLGLTLSHPGRIHFTYLDPVHAANGGRRHDSVTAGDVMAPAYVPSVIVISENKDTAVAFLPVDGAVAVEGDGYGPIVHASVPWLAGAPLVLYWGDMDADGFRILNQFRAAGINAVSILMDPAAFRAYGPFGTNVDRRGSRIVPVRSELGWLTNAEQEVYDALTDPAWTGYRRIEQERIPLGVAQAAVLQAVEEASRSQPLRDSS